MKRAVAAGNIIDRQWRIIRVLALGLITVMMVMNFVALAELVRALLAGEIENGTTLLIDAVIIWMINIIVFALWFWGLDGGGPAVRHAHGKPIFEFLFPQATCVTRRRIKTPPFYAGLRRLSVPVLHQRDRVFADRHHAAVAARQAPDDGGGDDLAADHRVRRGARGEYSGVVLPAFGDTERDASSRNRERRSTADRNGGTHAPNRG